VDLTGSATKVAEGVLGDAVTFRARVPAREAVSTRWPSWVDQEMRDLLAAAGITSPWRHQAEAASTVWRGQDVALATGTASGKSLAYQLAALSWARRAPAARRATSLYVAPTKALAADQASGLLRLAVPGVRVAVVDGDSTRQERDWAQRHADIVLTNPDMLHRSMLPGHRRWAEFFAGLRLVVVDEAHHYRGVFGSHVAWVLRRLERVVAGYRAAPRVMLLSATVAEPRQAAQHLSGRGVSVISEDASPRGSLDLLMADATARPGHGGLRGWTSRLLAELVAADHQTIAFLRSRRGAEAVAADAAAALREDTGEGLVAAYRGGYLPGERRALEADLRSRRLTGVAATNALELGVDISGMDAVIVQGWPGTRAAFWQQAGRAGRGSRDALAVLLAGDDPLEQYVIRHPQVLVGAPVERTVIDPGNPYVAARQICAAAAELPWRADELDALPSHARRLMADLVSAGTLRARQDGWYWPRPQRPADETDIRGSGAPGVRLVEADTGRLLGTVDAARAPATVHPGAVYVHQGAVFVVTELDLAASVALLIPGDPGYDTQASTVSEVRIVAEHSSRRWGGVMIAHGLVDVTSRVVAFHRRRWDTGAVLAEAGLDLPARVLRTSGCWWTLPDELVLSAGLTAPRVTGAAHAAEHACLGLLPLFATCDRWDVGGVYAPNHPDTGRLTVLVHDTHPGGTGFAARGFETAEAWLTAARGLVAGCGCLDGCPSCVQSPTCSTGNTPLDKAGAVSLLTALLDQAPGEAGLPTTP